jgi:hypothetical protein
MNIISIAILLCIILMVEFVANSIARSIAYRFEKVDREGALDSDVRLPPEEDVYGQRGDRRHEKRRKHHGHHGHHGHHKHRDYYEGNGGGIGYDSKKQSKYEKFAELNLEDEPNRKGYNPNNVVAPSYTYG